MHNILVETSNYGRCTLLLPLLISGLQKTTSPGLEPKKLFPNADNSEIFYWFQDICAQNLQRIGTSLLQLQANMRTHIPKTWIFKGNYRNSVSQYRILSKLIHKTSQGGWFSSSYWQIFIIFQWLPYQPSSFPFPFVSLQRRGCLVAPLFLWIVSVPCAGD
jgi:hypothetical protein